MTEIDCRPRRRAGTVCDISLKICQHFLSLYQAKGNEDDCPMCVILCPAFFLFVISHINSGAELRDCIVEVVGLGKSSTEFAAR